VRRAELLVDAESLTEGSRGLVAVPSMQAATRESFKRARLLGWQVDTVCYGQRAFVASTGVGLPSVGQCQFTRGVQDLGLTLDNAQVLKQGKSPLKQGASSDEVSACSRERAHAVQYVGLAHAVSKLAIEVQGALLARGSCCVIPVSLLCAAEPVQSIGLAEAITEFAVQCERLLLIGRCRYVLAEGVLHGTEEIERIGLSIAVAEFAVQCERFLLISRCRCVLAVRMLDNCDVAENAGLFDLIS